MQSLKFTGTFIGKIQVRIDAEKVERLKKTMNRRQKKTFILIRLRSASMKYT